MCEGTYTFEDNSRVKGHMQGEAFCSIGEAVFLDSVASGVALLHSKKPSWESDVLQLYVMKEGSQNNTKHPVFSNSGWGQNGKIKQGHSTCFDQAIMCLTVFVMGLLSH